jgi:hypothetical protein
MSSSSQVEEKKENTKKKIYIYIYMQIREGIYLSSLASAFGTKHSSSCSFNIELSIFLKPCVSHLNFVIFKLRSSDKL